MITPHFLLPESVYPFVPQSHCFNFSMVRPNYGSIQDIINLQLLGNVEPQQISINFNGESDDCSQGKDINFEFVGFDISGQVCFSLLR